MKVPGIQTIPQDWDEARDIPFFRVTANLFSPAFCSGASVLLASNDDESEASKIAVDTAEATRATAGAVSELHWS